MAHYVDNKQFYAALIEYRKEVNDAEQSGADKPQIPEYIGACLYQIATRLSTKPNFINYTYRDEMISDGIENCINYLLNFDPEKSKNPFAYFTQIIYFAFLRRIQKEKKQVYIRQKSLERAATIDLLAVHQEHDNTHVQLNVDIDNDYMVDFVENFESKLKEKRK